MGSYYTRSKILLDGFRSFSSKISLKSPIQPSGFNTLPNTAKFSGHSSYYAIPQKKSSILRFCALKTRTKYSPFHSYAKRYYYVDRNQVEHFKPRGWSWHRFQPQNPENVIIVVLVVSGVLISVYFRNLETIPYSKRTHLVLVPKKWERKLGEIVLKDMKKDDFEGKILPATHPQSVRVRLISDEIIKALQRGLSHQKVWSDLGLAEEGSGRRETLMGLKEFGVGEEQMEGKWSLEDEVLDDKRVQQSRKKGQEKGVQSATSHLDGLDWEILVVEKPVCNAFCLPGGKIVIYTGLLEHCRSDAEIATIIGHEVGHVVARHAAERLTRNLWLAIFEVVLSEKFKLDNVKKLSNLLLNLPFSRRNELEADYIGLLLMASAGYDPRDAPQVYEKSGCGGVFESLRRNYFSTHPSGKKRAQLLAQAKVMEEALFIYREQIARRRI